MDMLPDPRTSPITGHLYRTDDCCAGMLWGEVRDSRERAAFMRRHLQAILDAGEFPDDYVGDGYTIEFLTPQDALIEFNFDESQRQTLPVQQIMDALDLIATSGRRR